MSEKLFNLALGEWLSVDYETAESASVTVCEEEETSKELILLTINGKHYRLNHRQAHGLKSALSDSL